MSGIHIKPSHKGLFTAKHISVQQGMDSPSPATRKQANFARMAKRHFKPLPGGKHKPSSKFGEGPL